jgi:hypothetical protein
MAAARRQRPSCRRAASNKLATFVDLHLLPQPSPELQDIDLAAISQEESERTVGRRQREKTRRSGVQLPMGEYPHRGRAPLRAWAGMKTKCADGFTTEVLNRRATVVSGRRD